MSKFACNNDLCLQKGKVVELCHYRSIVVENTVIYKDTTGKPIVCDACQTSLTNISKEEPGGYNCGLSLFGSKSNKEKKAILKKRAQKHMKECAEDRDYRDHQDVV